MPFGAVKEVMGLNYQEYSIFSDGTYAFLKLKSGKNIKQQIKIKF